MIAIELNHGKLAFVDDDMEHLRQYKWRSRKARANSYAVVTLKNDNGSWETISMHHAVVGFPLNGLETDHIDGNGCMNIRSNLRNVTRRQNLSNQARKREGRTSSRYVGVYWEKGKSKWRSQINIDGKQINLGRYKNEEDASKAYQEKLKELKFNGIC